MKINRIFLKKYLPGERTLWVSAVSLGKTAFEETLLSCGTREEQPLVDSLLSLPSSTATF